MAARVFVAGINGLSDGQGVLEILPRLRVVPARIQIAEHGCQVVQRTSRFLFALRILLPRIQFAQHRKGLLQVWPCLLVFFLREQQAANSAQATGQPEMPFGIPLPRVDHLVHLDGPLEMRACLGKLALFLQHGRDELEVRAEHRVAVAADLFRDP